MRRAWLLLAALPLAAVAVFLLVGPEAARSLGAGEGLPDAADTGTGLSSFDLVAAAEEDGLQCARCHYSPGPLWTLDWQRSADDGGWDLAVGPREPDVPLVAVAAGLEDPVAWGSGLVQGPMAADGTWSMPFEVPADVSSLFVRFHTERTKTLVPLAAGLAVEQTAPGPEDVASEVALVDPEGRRLAVPGPEADLHLALFGPDVVRPGSWRLEAKVDVDPSGLTGVGSVEAMRGPVHGAGPGAPAVFRFPDGPAPPANVTIRLHPYHDHAPFEDSEWDVYDTQPYEVQLSTGPGPPRPPPWATADPLAAWGDGPELTILERQLVLVEAYEDKPGHKDDGMFFSSKPKYYVPAAPVPAGTGLVRLEATWTPPAELPLLDIRVKPHGTLRYADALVMLREPGRAVFEWPVEPWQWDVADHAGGQHDVHGSWDFAPYFQPSGGPIERHEVILDLRALAVQG